MADPTMTRYQCSTMAFRNSESPRVPGKMPGPLESAGQKKTIDAPIPAQPAISHSNGVRYFNSVPGFLMTLRLPKCLLACHFMHAMHAAGRCVHRCCDAHPTAHRLPVARQIPERAPIASLAFSI